MEGARGVAGREGHTGNKDGEGGERKKNVGEFWKDEDEAHDMYRKDEKREEREGIMTELMQGLEDTNEWEDERVREMIRMEREMRTWEERHPGQRSEEGIRVKKKVDWMEEELWNKVKRVAEVWRGRAVEMVEKL